jgi:hypothetical protein
MQRRPGNLKHAPMSGGKFPGGGKGQISHGTYSLRAALVMISSSHFIASYLILPHLTSSLDFTAFIILAHFSAHDTHL